MSRPHGVVLPGSLVGIEPRQVHRGVRRFVAYVYATNLAGIPRQDGRYRLGHFGQGAYDLNDDSLERLSRVPNRSDEKLF